MLKFSTQTKQKSFSSLFKNKQQLNCSNIAGPSNGNNNTQGGENYVPAPTIAVLSTVNTQPLTIIPIYGSPTPPIPRRLTLPNSQQTQTAKQQRFSNSSSQSTSTTTISQSVPSSSTTTTSSSSSISPSSKTSSSSPPSCPPPSSSSGSLGSILTNSNTSSKSSRIFPSTRFFIALLLCLCYISLSISTSNISVSMVCMIKRTSAQFQQVQQQQMQSLQPNNNNNQNNMQYGINQINEQEKEKSDVFILLRRRKREKQNIQQQINSTSTSKQLLTEKQSECANSRRRRKHLNNNNREIRSTVYFESCHEAEKLSWSSTDQGIVFAAQNAGSLFMLFTGAHADRLNSKWTISGALILLVLSNALLPLVASISVWLVVVARLLTGLSDALLQPSTSSLITRWFPPKERPFAIGLITGGRQIGTLLILPLAGFLCSRQDILGGWPVIFYLSALIGIGILFAWLLMSADKPSKHFCTSNRERSFVEEKIAEERLGKRTERRKIPWKRLATCRPLYIGVAALICHEYPLVIMLQLLPKYINDVLLLSNTANGFVSALPIAVLFLAKTFSSSISSFIQANKKGRFKIGRTALAKWFNGIASLGLGICVGIVPLLHTDQQRVNAIFVLCLANAFAGLHTPGVQIALLQIAPAYTGIITGIAFGCVAIFSIVNKILSNYIVQSGSLSEWTIVFWIAAVIALLPVFFFTLWGSAERQHWASTGSTIRRKNTKRKNNFGKVFPMEEINKKEAANNSEQNNNNNSVFYINKIEKEINNSDNLETKTTTFNKENLKEIKINEVEEEDEELNINFDSESLTSVLRLQMLLENNFNENEDEEGDKGDNNIETINIKH